MTVASFNGGLLNAGRFVPLRCSDRSVLELASSPTVGHAEVGGSFFSVSDESPFSQIEPVEDNSRVTGNS
jgi:hypothetical protein